MAQRRPRFVGFCRVPWTLAEADAVDGRTLASDPSLQPDARNAGGEWVDEGRPAGGWSSVAGR